MVHLWHTFRIIRWNKKKLNCFYSISGNRCKQNVCFYGKICIKTYLEIEKTQAVKCSHPQNNSFLLNWINLSLHRGAFCQFPFRWIYYSPSSKSNRKGNWQNAPLCTVSFYLSHRHDATNFCPGSGGREVAAVICVDVQADLTVDQYALMSSVYLEDKPIYFLQVSILTIWS